MGLSQKQTSQKQVTQSISEKRIIFDGSFPHPICLELCDLDCTHGYEKEVFKALKSFSNKDEYNSRTPHRLHKDNKLEPLYRKAKEFGSSDVMSLDLKNRKDTYRLFYCRDKETGVYKILALCSDKSH